MNVSRMCFVQRLMFQGTPGVNVEWPPVLYPAPLPQYEGLSAPKAADPPKASEPTKEAGAPGKPSGVRQTSFYFAVTSSSTLKSDA